MHMYVVVYHVFNGPCTRPPTPPPLPLPCSFVLPCFVPPSSFLGALAFLAAPSPSPPLLRLVSVAPTGLWQLFKLRACSASAAISVCTRVRCELQSMAAVGCSPWLPYAMCPGRCCPAEIPA